MRCPGIDSTSHRCRPAARGARASARTFTTARWPSLLAAARAVEQADDSESRLFASTQVIDEARHVEWFTRLQQKLALPSRHRARDRHRPR